jgi:cobalt-zinc-cadmium efflux system protein
VTESLPARAEQRRALWIVLGANAVLMLGQIVAGIAFHSLTLLADAVHLVSDVSGLALAILAFRLAGMPATPRHSFGLQRAEVLAALGNAIILFAAAVWIFVEAARRLATPADVDGGGMVAVALAGLVVNVGSAWLLGRVRGRSLNMRGAFLHLSTDALSSLGALAAGLAVVAWGADRADPIVAIGVGVLVLWVTWRLVADSTHVLLEGTPKGIDPAEVERALLGEGGVADVHDLHLWSLASDVAALSSHVVLAAGSELTVHDAQARGERLKEMLDERFGIKHATIELECHGDHPPEREVPF